MQQPLPGPPKAGVGFLISLMKSSSNYSSVQENESKEEGSTPTPPPPGPTNGDSSEPPFVGWDCNCEA